MAALLRNKKTGRYAIQFRTVDGSGRRPILRLGKVSKAEAENWRTHVDHLNAALAGRRAPEWSTVQWLQTLSPKQHAKLVKYGLIQPREEEKAVPLATFLQQYIDKRTDLKRRTRINLEQAKGKLVDVLGAERDLRQITTGHAKDFRRRLLEKLAGATVATHIKKARQFFQDAVDLRLIEDNPFTDVKAGKQANPRRQQYVSPADAQKVIDHCPSVEWKTLFALARFGGLRVPSETSLLELADLDWDRDRFKVRSPKTEHHEGREFRWVPMFPALRPFLEGAAAAAMMIGARHVLAHLRTENPRTTALKIVQRAGLKPWPKLFQNLRSSCQTDLTGKHERHVVCAWLGNTEEVAKGHYLQVTDDHFRAGAGLAKSDAKSDAGGTGQQRTRPVISAGNPDKSGRTGTPSIPPRGVRPPGKSAEQVGIAKNGDAKSDANRDLSRATRAGRKAVSAGRGPDLRKSLAKIARGARRGGEGGHR
jgi:hypothetical protein